MTKKYHYIFLANSSWYLQNFRENTLKSFRGHGDVSCITPDLKQTIDEINFEKVRINPTGTSFSTELTSLFHLVLMLFKIKPSIIFSFNPKINLYSLICAKLLRVPIVINVSGVGTASSLTGLSGKIYRVFNRILMPRAEYIFFQNDSDFRELVDLYGLNSKNCEVLPGSGVDLKKFSPSNKVKGKRVFLLAARLIKPKGIIEYMCAAEKIGLKSNDAHFKLAGIVDNSDRAVSNSDLHRLTDFKWFEFLGARDDIHIVLHDIDCVVLPSYYPEGTPRSLLEAAAAGKVIITTDTPGCRDVVIEGINGFLVPPRDTKALKEAMEKVINLSDEKLAKMQANSRKLAEEKFDEQYVIQRYLNVAEKILAKKSK